MAYRNQNYMTNRKIKELVDKNQKDYVAPEEEPNTSSEPVDTEPSDNSNESDNTPEEPSETPKPEEED